MISGLIAEHRRIEELLEALANASDPEGPFHLAARHVIDHYDREDALLTPKLVAQHRHSRELIEHIQSALAAGDRRDLDSLIQQFIAITSHNMIEEERDWAASDQV